MTQRELELAVADATGEDISEINQRGFNLVDPLLIDFDPEPNNLSPQVIDWDAPYAGVTMSAHEAA
jgi:hypothetical protein